MDGRRHPEATAVIQLPQVVWEAPPRGFGRVWAALERITELQEATNHMKFDIDIKCVLRWDFNRAHWWRNRFLFNLLKGRRLSRRLVRPGSPAPPRTSL